jgi:hypothetical protein
MKDGGSDLTALGKMHEERNIREMQTQGEK